MPIPRAYRAIGVVVLGGGMTACALAVSTDGLSNGAIDADGSPPNAAEGGADAVADDRPFVPDVDDGDARTLPAGAVVWPVNGHAYALYIEPQGIAWTEARTRAQLAGGHLATLGSAAESAFVIDVVVSPKRNDVVAADGVGPWLGGWQPDPANATEPDGGWAWIDGTPWQYTGWQGGQPDNSGGVEQFLNLYGPGGVPLAWNDDSVGGSGAPIVGYVVELE